MHLVINLCLLKNNWIEIVQEEPGANAHQQSLLAGH
jgi:hypothetical protein